MREEVILFALVVLLMGAVLILVLRRKTENYSGGERIIWSYWNEDPPPEFIQDCIKTWRNKNPEYTVNIVNDQNLESFVGPEEAEAIKTWKYNDSPQRMSDLVRLSVLSKYGGIWLDASIVCYESLDWVFKEDPEKPKMYSIPELSTPEDPLIESWFISCSKGDQFVIKWNDEFRRVAEYDTIDDYVKDANVSMKGIDFPDYLLVYVCAKKIYKELGPESVKVLNASEGPYNYHLNGGVSSMCNKKPTSLVKFRKEDRAVLDDRLKSCVFSS